MISLDRLLDGLEVQVEPFFHADRCGPRSGSLELAGGATVRVSTASVSIEPARASVRGLPCAGMPRDLHGVGPMAFRTASAPPPPRAVSGRRTA